MPVVVFMPVPTRRPSIARGSILRLVAALGAASVAALVPTAAVRAQTAGPNADSSVFVQAARGRATDAYGLGITRDWSASWALGPGRLSGYWEAEAEAWRYAAPDAGQGPTRLVKIELAPIARFRGDAGRSPWFLDAGIGLTLTSHVYDSRNKRFSTAFNFGDQFAAGYLFGPRQEHELAIRYEHMSNARIKEPNPGINFFQLRYAYHFGG